MADQNEVEQWLSIIDYPRYEVSNFGNVRSLDGYAKRKDGSLHFWKGKTMSPGIDSRGYLQVRITNYFKRKCFSVHRLVGYYYVPNPENKPEINHKYGNKLDNRASNLEWVTRRENIDHAVNTGLMKSGSELSYSRPVLDTQTGIFYESISEAAIIYGIKGRTLHHWLLGDRKNKSNLILV